MHACRLIIVQRSVNTDGFKFNVETQLVPIIASKLLGDVPSDGAEKKVWCISCNKHLFTVQRHHPLLLNIISEQLKCKVSIFII